MAILIAAVVAIAGIAAFPAPAHAAATPGAIEIVSATALTTDAADAKANVVFRVPAFSVAAGDEDWFTRAITVRVQEDVGGAWADTGKSVFASTNAEYFGTLDLFDGIGNLSEAGRSYPNGQSKR
ncbi:MAG: hypothetical protein LBR00_00465 [Clostridiales Family XIII bacterium]|nr:hypothetical protein [Clostridiales Family XIII bacterium]